MREECDASGCGHKAKVSQTVREEEQPPTFQEQVSHHPTVSTCTLLDINEILFAISRLRGELFAHNY